MGASAVAPGLSGVHVHMSNSLNTPIEAIEHALPVRIRHYALRRDTGGAGEHNGGDGIRRDIELLTDAEVNLLTERRVRGPRGANGGADGDVGKNLVNGSEVPAKVTLRLAAGDVLSVRTPGGGGFGSVRA